MSDMQGQRDEHRLAMRQAIRSVVTAAVISIAAVALIGGIVAFRISPNLSGSEPEKITQDAVSGPTPSASTTPEAITVTEPQMKLLKLATVELRTFQDERIAFGEIAPNEDLMTPIFAPYTGRIARLQAKPGDHVAKGDPLFEIDSVDLVQAEGTMISAAGTLQKTRSQLDLTTRALARQRALLRANAAAQKDVEQAEADQRGAESDVRAAIGSLAAAQDAVRIFGKTDAQTTRILETRRIDPLMPVYSPIAGSVIARKAGPGQLVQPSNSDPVYVIADLTTVWLVASVPELDIPAIHLGDDVTVRVAAYPKQVFRARITNIGSMIDPVTRRVAVRSEVDAKGYQLKAQMFASFRIVADVGAPTPAVPNAALVRDGDNSTVWIARGTRLFESRRVDRGIEQAGMVQILTGLQAGETIVVEGAIFLSNAADVSAR